MLLGTSGSFSESVLPRWPAGVFLATKWWFWILFWYKKIGFVWCKVSTRNFLAFTWAGWSANCHRSFCGWTSDFQCFVLSEATFTVEQCKQRRDTPWFTSCIYIVDSTRCLTNHRLFEWPMSQMIDGDAEGEVVGDIARKKIGFWRLLRIPPWAIREDEQRTLAYGACITDLSAFSFGHIENELSSSIPLLNSSIPSLISLCLVPLLLTDAFAVNLSILCVFAESV